MASIEPSFFIRNEFLIRRLHSLTGLVFGGYMMVHLLTNASILGGAAMFQKNVLAIHGFGPALVVLEFTALTLPLVVVWSNTVATLVPIAAERYKIDPTVISAPLITTIVDATALLIYFSLAKLILGL